ncbi:hypothetical protein D8674_017428 [Pyrus ussuriensis x Pyrus communis]|uniref:Integrase catalytic domain-containing protein n=1 Tax=Pyrus ussuriensis x Pyrus communis TaxID=2448454 RepID=A0A5N5HDP6_9ROSA|nr:hypothetical protein D8674_017428 [Pyrus ussuriensis x Pyrus communis]
MVQTKLKRHNYLVWKSLFDSIFCRYKLTRIVDGFEPPPPQFLTDESGNLTSFPNLNIIIWINSTISEDLILFTVGVQSARELWQNLERRFGGISRSHIHKLRTNLQSMNKGLSSIFEYLQRIKEVTDALAAVDPSHQAIDCSNRMNPNFQGRIPPAKLAMCANNSTYSSPPWLIDSGASSHIINNIQNLQNLQPYTGPDKVYIGDGQALVENLCGTKIGTLRSDSGGEFLSSAFKQHLAQHGIQEHLSCPYTPQQNGCAERKHIHVVETARTLLLAFNQEGIDFSDTFCPVAKPVTIRILLTLAVQSHWFWHKLDVSNAFLHGNLKENVFITQPSGFLAQDHPHHVCHLKKSLYGLRQAPRAYAKKQHTVARSSTEAEYRSLAHITAEITWICQLFADIGFQLPVLPQIWCDNVSAIALASNSVFHTWTKHVEIDYHYIRELVLTKLLAVSFVCSQDQLADIHTKSLPCQQFLDLRSKLSLQSSPFSLRGCEENNKVDKNVKESKVS